MISDAVTGAGPFLSFPRSIALDEAGNRAFVVDIVLDEILSVDLASGDRVVVSDLDSADPIILNVPSVILDQAHARAFAVDVEIEGLLVVELGTGQRAVVSR